jgi:hypothetical protein
MTGPIQPTPGILQARRNRAYDALPHVRVYP